MTSRSTIKRLAIQDPYVLIHRIELLEKTLEAARNELQRPKKPNKAFLEYINLILEVRL